MYLYVPSSPRELCCELCCDIIYFIAHYMADAIINVSQINIFSQANRDLCFFVLSLSPVRTAYASIPYLNGIAFTYRLKYDGIYELCDGIKAANNGTPFDGQFCQLYIPVEESVSYNV